MSETTSELAVHLAAAAHQADAVALTDSAQFMGTIERLGPDTPGFIGRVSEAVRQVVEADRERFGPGAVAVVPPEPVAAEPLVLSRNEQLARAAARRAELTADYTGQISAADVQLAEPAVVNAWATSGRLAHLGVAAKTHRRR